MSTRVVCPNGDCENKATIWCDGCDMTLCRACHILHNEDLDGDSEAGFVVIDTMNMATINSECLSIMGARELAAQARMEDGNNEIYVYRVGPVGEVGDE